MMSQDAADTPAGSPPGFQGALRLYGFRRLILSFGLFTFIAGFFFFDGIKAHINLFYALVLGTFLITLPFYPFRELMRSRIVQLFLILVAYLMLTLLWGPDVPRQEFLRAAVRAMAVLGFFLLAAEHAYAIPGSPRVLFGMVCWVSFLGAVLVIRGMDGVQISPGTRLNDLGVLRNAIQIGAVYGMVVVLSAFSFMQRHTVLKALPYILPCAAALFILVMSESRGPMAALYITLLMGGLFSRDSRMLFLLCVITAASALLMAFGNEYLRSLIVVRGFSLRDEIFLYTWGLIREKMVFGQGILAGFSMELANGLLIRHPHNLYLTTWFYGGVVGLALLVAFLARAFWQACRVFLRYGDFTYAALLMYASICVFTGNDRIIDHPVPLYLFFFLPLGLLAGLERAMASKENHEHGPS